jgi:hypothetical protein
VSQDELRAADERDAAAKAAYADFLARLRSADPAFAEASVLQSDTWGEWQAAVYLLTGCDVAWRELGGAVMEARNIAPVFEELEHPTCSWSSGEREVLVWAAHFWDHRQEAGLPYGFDGRNYNRWLVALHLRRGIAPQVLLRS